MKKIRLSKEISYFTAILILSFSVAMISSTGFGVSMIVAPAYILSQKLGFVTFGQAEYIVQGIWFILFCALMRRFKLQYIFSFITGVIYGAVLDLWRLIIPHFNPSVTEPGTMTMWLRIVYFACGMTLTSFAIALFFQTYLYPQVYDFFVKYVSRRFKLDRSKFKMAFDFFNLALATALTLIFFRRFVGVGVGTVIMTALNGILIGLFTKFLEKHFEFYARFPRSEAYFEAIA